MNPAAPASDDDYPPHYPREWEADVLLTDGHTAHLRPVRPDDADDLVRFYARVSAESKYLRFFAPYPRLSARDVERFTVVDYHDRVALVMRLADEMIAIGRYDRVGEADAEVAFLVEDAHQGRGIAQLLLEHLAEAARERGITKFVAEVLPQNRAMVKVFADAGYHVRKDVEDGVIAVDFPILPTNTLVGVMERREHRAEGASMRRLMHPKSVAVLGPGHRAQELVHSLLQSGFHGRVCAVATDGQPISGVPTAPSVAELDGSLDLLLAAIPPSQMGQPLIEAAHKGAHTVVALTGSGAGPNDSQRLISLARAYGLRAVGPDALGVINTARDLALNASPAPMPRAGGVGLFCQSAAIGIGLLNSAAATGLGISSFISTGDLADVTANDVMQYWEDDEQTRVCVLSLDSIGNPRKFSRIIRRLARRKPVIVFAPGRATRSSHIGDRGGLHHAPSEAIDALFRQSGVIVLHRRDAMFDLAEILARQPLPPGRRVCMVTNSASLRHQAAQTAARLGMEITTVVLEPELGYEKIVATVRTMVSSPDHDVVICAMVDGFGNSNGALRDALSDLAASPATPHSPATPAKPLIAAFVDFDNTREELSGADTFGSLPIFRSVTDVLQALGSAMDYAAWLARDQGAVPLWEHDEDGARQVINSVLAQTPEGRTLDQVETRDLLRCFGIRVVPSYPVTTWSEALAHAEALGWNVVLKATAPGVRGRQDLAGVYRNLHDEAELADAWRDLGSLLHTLGQPAGEDLSVAQPVIQAMMPVGVSLAVESREDYSFGPIVHVGLEGLASDLLSDVVYGVPPLTTKAAAQMVRDLRAAPVLFGSYGGNPPVKVEALEELLHRVAQLSDGFPQLAQIRLSPCIVSAVGLSVVGAKVVVAPTSEQRDSLARSLG